MSKKLPSLTAAYKGIAKGVEQMREQNEARRVALVPFARLLKEHHEDLPDSQPLYGIGDSLITVGDLRRAVAAIAEPTNKEKA